MSLVHSARRSLGLRMPPLPSPTKQPGGGRTTNLVGSSGASSFAPASSVADELPELHTLVRDRLHAPPDGLWTLPLPTPALRERLNRLRWIHDQLDSLPSLAPGPKVNRLFTDLVALTADVDDDSAEAILREPAIREAIPRLRNLCARGEALLERHWQHRIVSSPDAEATLREFPYHQNYRDLTQMEVRAIQMASGENHLPKKLLFIGSGSLPLTSLMLSRDYGFQVDNLDIDPHAVVEGRELTRRLGLGKDQIRFAHTDIFGLTPEELASYDGFYVAALAGLNPSDKEAIFRHLAEHAKPGALLIARSAFRLRKLLYPEVQPEQLKGFAPQMLVHPLNDVVNSVLVARKEAGPSGRAP